MPYEEVEGHVNDAIAFAEVFCNHPHLPKPAARKIACDVILACHAYLLNCRQYTRVLATDLANTLRMDKTTMNCAEQILMEWGARHASEQRRVAV